jgi:hypothetical protein
MSRVSAAGLVLCVLAIAPAAHATDVDIDVDITLSGSPASMQRQNAIARGEAYTFLSTPIDVWGYVLSGNLVHLPGNDDYAVTAGFPYARAFVRTFIERLAADYHAACGDRLVVTSLTRPSTQQPRNASPLSVHPAGMAVDLRVSPVPECRNWLVLELLELEELGVLDATLERNPPHFHVAVFPAQYRAYEQAIAADSTSAEAVRLLEAAVASRDSAIAQAEADNSPRSPGLVRFATWLARAMLPLHV